MRYCSACLFLLVGLTSASADGPALKEARLRWLRGNYGEGREQYEALVKNAKDRPAALLGIARSYLSEGEYDKALATLDTGLKDAPKDADLHAQRADLLYHRGRWEDADKAARQALEENKDQF